MPLRRMRWIPAARIFSKRPFLRPHQVVGSGLPHDRGGMHSDHVGIDARGGAVNGFAAHFAVESSDSRVGGTRQRRSAEIGGAARAISSHPSTMTRAIS